ncbi:MAG TPA: sugar transferase [Peptococcaceae bacterium]|nr:sugar transferase [Peptococcaceae bacterium]
MLRENGTFFDELSRVLDVLLIAVSFYLTVCLYASKMVAIVIWPDYFLPFIAYLICWIICANILKVYQSRRIMAFYNEVYRMCKAHFLSLAASLILVLLYDPHMIQNRFLIYFGAYAVSLTIGLHAVTRLSLYVWRKRGRNTKYILLLGSGPAAALFLNRVNQNKHLGYKVIGYLAPQRNGLQVPYLGDYPQIEDILKSRVVDLVVITESLSYQGIRHYINTLDEMGKNVVFLLDEMASMIQKSRPIDFDGLPMVAYDSRPVHPTQTVLKRIIDVIGASFGLIILSPLFLIVAIIIKLTSEGPVIFTQNRVGLNGRIFKMYKFRSMVANAEELKARLAHLNEMNGPVFKIKNDPRITPIGRFLRKTSIDELPQLWNVLKGDMSLVGPRPPLPSEVDMYNPKHRKRLAVKPGITCIWQISGRNEIDFEQWMEMDAEYVDRWTLWLDLKILMKTVPVVLLRKGAS